MSIRTAAGQKIVIVDGVRTPFCKAGTALKAMNAVDLAAAVFRGLADRLNLDLAGIDEVILGCVGQPADAQNIARAAALRAGVPRATPAVTVHRNCASGFEAVTTAVERILAGRGGMYLVGGSESMSNYPLLYPPAFGEWLGALARARKPLEKLAALLKFRPSMLTPRFAIELGLTDHACGLSMGVTAENLAVEFGITREEQDAFALESHRRAVAAAPLFSEEILPVSPAPYRALVGADNGPRPQQSMEDLARLKPYFDRRSGTVTVGNACPITDGAAALLVTTEDRARALGYEPLASIRSYAYAGCDPERMGLGPVYATTRALGETPLAAMELIELNEAFAAQVIACERAFDSKAFAAKELGRAAPLGPLDRRRLNVNGGAIAMGHPVGATGARLLLTLAREMKRRGAGLGLATLCIGGGQGGALVIERE